jgi:uncharacterized phage-like protein YoqJ
VVILAATGHRPNKLGGYSPRAEARVVDFAAYWISLHRPAVMIVGMALGWDTACAQACLALGVPFVAAIPFRGQEQRWPDAAQLRYHKLLSASCELRVISSVASIHAMQARNRWMVDNCTNLVALWDGSQGGTKNCVEYAEVLERPYSNPWHEFSRLAGLA